MAKPIAPETLRAWYAHKQGLDGSLSGATPAQVLERSGWSRSIGSAGPYFTFQSRAGISREAADAAVAKLEIHELPAARNCTYVLPARDFALGLKVGQSFSGAEMRVAAKLGVTEKEIDKLCDAVLKALSKDPLTPDELRSATGNASRSLGEEGKKKGLSTTLPLALGRLQAQGETRRVSMNGRLDQQRFRYATWKPSPLAKFKLSDEEAFAELARLYFSWIGPATPAQFQEFAGIGVKASKAALEPLKLVALAEGDERLLFPADLDALLKFVPPKTPQYVLTSTLDSIVIQRQELLDPADAAHKIFKDEFPGHYILDRGRIVGIWAYDVPTESIAWMSFVKKNRDLEAAVKRTETFIREQLGDARTFGLDTPASRAVKIAALRMG